MGGVARKNHGTPPFLNRAGRSFFPQEQGYSDVGAPDRMPLRPAPFCGSRAGSPGRILFPAGTLNARVSLEKEEEMQEFVSETAYGLQWVPNRTR